MKKRVPAADIDDLVSDGSLGLWEAARDWDPHKGKFDSYAATVEWRRMVDGMRARWGHNFRPANVMLSSEQRSSLPSVEEAVIIRERLREAVNMGSKEIHDRSHHLVTVLTIIELDVLIDSALGFSAQETADRRHKAVQTVKTQRCQIMKKLGARGMTNAVYIATQRGILS